MAARKTKLSNQVWLPVPDRGIVEGRYTCACDRRALQQLALNVRVKTLWPDLSMTVIPHFKLKIYHLAVSNTYHFVLMFLIIFYNQLVKSFLLIIFLLILKSSFVCLCLFCFFSFYPLFLPLFLPLFFSFGTYFLALVRNCFPPMSVLEH